jgi:hypothetical protein
MTTNAMPLRSGTFFRKSSSASRPPAEAPMPTMGNMLPSLGRGAGKASAIRSGASGGFALGA